MTTYKDAGVDAALKAELLKSLSGRVQAGRPEVIGGLGGFGGLFRAPTGKEMVLVATTDGVGTKTELARMLDRYEVVGTDVVHQSVNDALAAGAEPLFFLDYFASGVLSPDIFTRVVDAVAAACAANGCALLGGETAEMPGVFAPGAFDIVGFLVGAAEREALLDPAAVRDGDALVGLPSTGLHTNGYSLARLVVSRLAENEGRSMVDALRAPRPLLGGTLGDALLQTHRSYLADVRALRAATEVKAMAHLTGGGWEGNLPRALPAGMGAQVDRGAWTVPPLFRFLAEAGRIADEELWDTWNMGIGMIAVVSDPAAAVRAVPGAVRLGSVERLRAGAARRVRFA